MMDHKRPEPARGNCPTSFCERYKAADDDTKNKIAREERDLRRPSRRRSRQLFDEWIVLKEELKPEVFERLTVLRKGDGNHADMDSWNLWSADERKPLIADRVHYLEKQIIIHDTIWVVKNWRRLAAAGGFTAIAAGVKWLIENYDKIPWPWTIALDNPTASPWFFALLIFIGSLAIIIGLGRR